MSLINNKLYDICFPNSISSQDAESFIRWNGPIIANKTTLFLPKGSAISTDTYHNFFAVKKLREFTFYNDFRFEINGIGKCQVELIAVAKTEFYIFEHVISISQFSGNFSGNIEFTDKQNNYEALYLRILAFEDVTINNIGIYSNDDIPQNNISVAYCICSYNRESYISSFVKDIASHFLGNDQISFYITINGKPYSIDFTENFDVLNNRNLGGAGGFTKSMMAALEKGIHSHVILADDDIYIEKISIYKTLAILKALKPEYSDYFISGAMLSGDEKWLQYERNATLTSKGFIHHGAYEDTRAKQVAFNSAIAPTHKGIAGWWYCCIPVKVIMEYDLPLPVFVRGDDVEYSIRCAKNILSFNGICVWHEPFFKKYNEIMEDYYLVRNLTMISLIYNQDYSDIKREYVYKKFFKNIFVFDYVAAKLNIKALEDILTQQYLTDPEDTHKIISNYKNKCINYKEYYDSADFFPSRKKHIRKIKLRFKKILQYIFDIKGGSVSSLGGYDRNPCYFLGKKRAKIYMGNNTYRIYRFKFTQSWKLIILFLKCYRKITKQNEKLRQELISFRDKSSKSDAWNKIFNKK